MAPPPEPSMTPMLRRVSRSTAAGSSLASLQRFVRRGDDHRHDARDVLHVLRIDPERRIEIDLAGDARRKRGGVELRDGADAGAAGFQRGEVIFAADAVRAESADAGDDDSLVGHLGARQRDGQEKDCKRRDRDAARNASARPPLFRSRLNLPGGSLRSLLAVAVLVLLAFPILAQTPSQVTIAPPPPAAPVAPPDPAADALAKRTIDAQGGAAWEKARFFSFTFVVERNGQAAASFPQQWDRVHGRLSRQRRRSERRSVHRRPEHEDEDRPGVAERRRSHRPAGAEGAARARLPPLQQRHVLAADAAEDARSGRASHQPGRAHRCGRAQVGRRPA